MRKRTGEGLTRPQSSLDNAAFCALGVARALK